MDGLCFNAGDPKFNHYSGYPNGAVIREIVPHIAVWGSYFLGGRGLQVSYVTDTCNRDNYIGAFVVEASCSLRAEFLFLIFGGRGGGGCVGRGFGLEGGWAWRRLLGRVEVGGRSGDGGEPKALDSCVKQVPPDEPLAQNPGR